jgi:nicotinamidase-related amidase
MAVRGLEPGTRAALVINECQNGMVNPAESSNQGLAAQAGARGIVSRIARLAEAFRSVGAPVVHTTIVLRPDGAGTAANCLLLGSLKKKGAVVEGRKEAEIHPELTPHASDIVVQRVHGLAPFHGSELEPILRERGVTTVVLAGVSTNVGIPGAALEAVNRGFTVVVAEDCTAGAWPEAHEFQVTHTLPLLATVAASEDIAAALVAGAQTTPA